MTRALLIVDVQVGMYAFEDFQPYRGGAVIGAINRLIEKARKADRPVIFVRHAGREGHPLQAGSSGHAIDPRLHINDADPIVDKSHCVAFRGTTLVKQLTALNVTELVICGLQTDHCVDSAVRIAVDQGYKVIIAADAHTTYDTEYLPAKSIIQHHEAVWSDSFGLVQPVESIEFAA